MSGIDQIMQSLQQTLARSEASLTIQGDSEFNKTLNLGQIIKGKVLRHYDGGKYLVSFNGQEKVVDSAIPLRTNDIIYGRIVGVDDKVHLKQVRREQISADSETNTNALLKHFNQGDAKLLQNLFDKYNAKLSPQDQLILANQLKYSAKPNLLAMSGLLLSKLGINVSSEALRSIYRVLGETDSSLKREIKESIQLDIANSRAPTDNDDSLKELARVVMAYANHQENDKNPANDLGDSKLEENRTVGLSPESVKKEREEKRDTKQQESYIGRWILNSQQDGSVSHNLTKIPLMLGDHVVEVNLALFSQHDHTQSVDGVRHRRLVFNLNTDSLGYVEITVSAANRSLSIQVGSDRQQSVEKLALYVNELKSVLNDYDWSIDDISYGLVSQDVPNTVIRSVVEHHISKDSINRLM